VEGGDCLSGEMKKYYVLKFMSSGIVKVLPGNCRLCNTNCNYVHHFSGKTGKSDLMGSGLMCSHVLATKCTYMILHVYYPHSHSMFGSASYVEGIVLGVSITWINALSLPKFI
jgi:hypothetical protein